MGLNLESLLTQKDVWRRDAQAGRLYAVIDSCDEPAVPAKVAEVGPDRAVSLYRGSAEEKYESIAPYLFRVDGGLFGWIDKELWHAPWGIFASADASLEELRTHFRHFLTAKGTDGKKYLLRFYDPRVLPGFLESCNTEELIRLFGPVARYGAPKGDDILSLTAARTS